MSFDIRYIENAKLPTYADMFKKMRQEMKQDYYVLYNEETGEFGEPDTFPFGPPEIDGKDFPIILDESELSLVRNDYYTLNGFKLRRVRLEILPEQ